MTKTPKGQNVERDIRVKICKIVSTMLDNPDQHGIYPTTKCYDQLEELLNLLVQNVLLRGGLL